MTQEQIANKLSEALLGRIYQGSLSKYAASSIESGRSNYPVANLLTYCQDMGLQFVFEDTTTEDKFYPISILDLHRYIGEIMHRYQIDCKRIYLKTELHYTPPKSFDERELQELKRESKQSVAPLSIKTFLAICSVLHCDLRFEPK